MDQNYTPQMPMATPGMPMQPGPSPMPTPTPPTPEGGTLGGDLLQQPTEQPKKSHKGLIIGVIAAVIVIAAVLIIILVVIIPSLGSNGGSGKADGLAGTAIKLTDKIRNSGKNQVIYLYDDLKKLDDSIDFKATSYIYFDKNDAKICLTNGEHRASNLDGDLKDEKTADGCNFTLTDSVATAYLENYYASQKAVAGATEKINDYYIVKIDGGAIYCKIAYNNNQIVVTADTDTIKKIETIDELVDAITYYVENIMNSKIGSNQEVVDVKIMEGTDFEYVMIQNSTDYKTSLKFADNLGQYLADHNCANRKIGVRALVWDDSGIHNSYLIRITIENGKHTVDTLQDPINE